MKNYKLDAYEKEIEDAFGRGEYKPVKNMRQEIKRHRAIAHNTKRLLQKNKNINIRLQEMTVWKLKQKAAREGLPYQTLIGSILYKYANGTL